MSCIMEGFMRYLTLIEKMPQFRANMYLNFVRRFHNHVGKSYVDIKKSDVQNYLAFLEKEEHLKDSSSKIHLMAIRKFYKYLLSRRVVTKMPSDGIRLRGWRKPELTKK